MSGNGVGRDSSSTEVPHTAVADSPATSKLKHKDKPTTPVKSEKKGGVHAIKQGHRA
ncbi:hypothetical protein RvY_03055 [Ramazzottius varieornatus]|uniref:Uncharacterized protein n=1 Tax=Ramazzottius varieornatus TaxID=947166 RepID=A0A1D1UQ78_RAMVA|nr:hypothetical protein RvY_03055 [Ramazzottius varieornatus]